MEESREEFLVDMPISDFWEMCSKATVVDLQAFGGTMELAKKTMAEYFAGQEKQLYEKFDYMLCKDIVKKMLEIQSLIVIISQKQSICKHWEYVKMPECFKN